ncbi:MAG TPA: LD-carboxypeptidase [Edaphobacter sp.]|nr:LD-carboxypeptidase [Edaphobacter sp.]
MSSRNAIKPAALRAGATLAIVSPASAPKPELVYQGIERLHELGYKTVLGEHALDRGPLYYAGTLEHRLKDLHDAFANPDVDGIICVRGGWGSAELLPHLDASLIRANPKAFIGYSDHTSLHTWLRNEANLITFHGPMVAADFAHSNGVDLDSWQHCFGGDADWVLNADSGLRILRAGKAEGILEGGCIAILAEALGTLFAPRIEDSILFLEDIGVKPYQWDRMLLHLRYSGILKSVRGIVFGDMQQCVNPEENDLLERAILHALRDFQGPIAIGLRSGHVNSGNITLPFGVPVRLDLTDAENPQMHFLEAAVAV